MLFNIFSAYEKAFDLFEHHHSLDSGQALSRQAEVERRTERASTAVDNSAEMLTNRYVCMHVHHM